MCLGVCVAVCLCVCTVRVYVLLAGTKISEEPEHERNIGAPLVAASETFSFSRDGYVAQQHDSAETFQSRVQENHFPLALAMSCDEFCVVASLKP